MSTENKRKSLTFSIQYTGDCYILYFSFVGSLTAEQFMTLWATRINTKNSKYCPQPAPE